MHSQIHMSATINLAKKLATIRSIFDTQALLKRPALSVESISRYYRINQLAYRWFHSAEGFVHMGISSGGSFQKEDFLAQAKLVAGYLREDADVLELAMGKGANSEYLARRFPQGRFEGLDLAHGQAGPAFRRARQLKNFFPASGDFHDLGRYAEATFDCVFVIEALCHSDRKQRVFTEVWRVLKPGGTFIVIDGYTAKSQSECTADEWQAKRLVEKGMMVGEFEGYGEVRQQLLASGFALEREEDATRAVMPSLRKIETKRIITAFFRLPLVARLLTKVLPGEFTGNAISGYLLADLCERGVLLYQITVAKKR